MSQKAKRYAEEFKQEAVNQVVKHGYSVAEVARHLGVTTKSLYTWKNKYSKPSKSQAVSEDMTLEIARLKKQLRRAEQERDTLKEATAFFASESKKTLPIYKISQSLLLR